MCKYRYLWRIGINNTIVCIWLSKEHNINNILIFKVLTNFVKNFNSISIDKNKFRILMAKEELDIILCTFNGQNTNTFVEPFKSQLEWLFAQQFLPTVRFQPTNVRGNCLTIQDIYNLTYNWGCIQFTIETYTRIIWYNFF